MSDVGEKAFLRNLLPQLEKADTFLNGFGDDASIIDIGLPEHAIAFKIDRAARPMGAYRGWGGFDTWGRLAVNANVSDLLAVGAVPKGFMLSVTVPRTWSVAQTEAIVRGAVDECERYNIAFLGGDTKEGSEPNVVGAAIGIVDKKKVTGRKSAQHGEAIVLAGQLGGFASAYMLLNDEIGTNSSAYVDYVSHPSCAYSEATYLFDNFDVSSALDLSDGLWEGLNLLPRQKNSFILELDKLPLHQFALEAAAIYSMDARNFAFTVGDWAMLFTMPQDQASMAISHAPSNYHLSIIGSISRNVRPVMRSITQGMQFEMNFDLTNEHFVSRMESEEEYFSKLRSCPILKRLG